MEFDKDKLGFIREKIEVSFSEGKFDKGIEILSEILVNNPNFWGHKELYLSYGSGDKFKFIRLLDEGLINIYRYTFKEPEGELSKEDERDFRDFIYSSRARSGELYWLYFKAYMFFKENGYSLRFIRNSSTYMKTETIEYIEPNTNLYPESIIEDDKIIVRCGEIDADRILGEIYRGAEYLWIFPYITEDKTDDIAECYLLKIDPKLKDVFIRESMEVQRKVIEATNRRRGFK